MKIGEKIEVEILKIVPNGFGLAFAENSTVFVPLAAKGDRLLVNVNEKKGKILFAEIVEIIEPSPDRTEPKCPYFGRCGGCNFQQLNYQAQLDAKVAIVRDCLTRIGKINYEKEIEVVGSPRQYGYRARAQWHLNTRRKRFGYFQRKSHEIIDVEVCPILTDELENTLTDLRGEIAWESFWSEIVEIEAANSGGEISLYSAEIIEPTDEIAFAAQGEKYFYDATIFFQGNPFLIESLIETALGNATGEIALDLYCGVGLFTLPLSKRFKKVTGVEANAKAISFAKKNIERAEFTCENVENFLTENQKKLESLDFVVLDPPRAGAEPETIEKLLQIKPKEISYVSCEPSTLARDLRRLCENYYRIESITALDLFPQTHHVETVVRLKLQN